MTYYIVNADYLDTTLYVTRTATGPRSALQEALGAGRITKPGRYVVACPDSGALNALEFNVHRPVPGLVIESV